ESMSAEQEVGPEPTDWLSGAPLAELAEAVRSQSDPSQRRDAQAEWHRRLALPVAALMFGVLAVPLCLSRRQLSRSGGLVLGLTALGAALARACDPPGLPGGVGGLAARRRAGSLRARAARAGPPVPLDARPPARAPAGARAGARAPAAGAAIRARPLRGPALH